MKNSIKREQSQACLNFAERKNFRLQAKYKIIMTLALLITAVGGAWAQGPWTSGSCTVTLSNGTLTVSGNGTMDDYANISDRPWDGNKGDITSVVVESGVTTVGAMSFCNFGKMTSVTLPEGLTSIGTRSFLSCGKLTSITIPSTVTSIGAEAFYSCMSVTDVNLYADPANLTWNEDGCDDFNRKPKGSTKCHVLAEYLTAYQTKFNGQVNVTFVGDLQPLATSDVEVTTNKAENDTVFTEAWFNMPAFDATAEYELVRDMSIQMTATMGDGTDGVRYRVKKAQQGGGYEPAEMDMMQVLALVAVNDGIEQKALTQDQDYYCRIYKLDEQTLQPEGDGVMLYDFDFAPGLYALKAFAQDDSDYAGETALSNTFKLFQGYEVEVAAKEFITYYKDEPLYVEDEAAELYTIESVNGDQAVLSDRSDAMPSNTPMLVYNKSNETKVILLIPCAEPDMAITVAPEFQGTLTGTTIAASTEGTTNYALNGKAFVFVKNAIEVGPNKAWLSVNTGVPSARITIVFDDATKIANTNITNITNGNWYTIDGRKVNAPSKKGIYIMNGKKVVVK